MNIGKDWWVLTPKVMAGRLYRKTMLNKKDQHYMVQNLNTRDLGLYVFITKKNAQDLETTLHSVCALR